MVNNEIPGEISFPTVNVQDMPVAIVVGMIEDSGERRYVRLMSVQDETNAISLMIVGPTDIFKANSNPNRFLFSCLLFDS